MRDPKLRYRLPGLLLAAALFVLPARPAETSPTDNQALQQKTEEVERLKRELDRQEKELRQLQQENERLRKDQQKQDRQQKQEQQRSQQAEIERLRQENERLRQEPSHQHATATAPAARELKPVTPIENLPPLGPDSVVEVDELVGHFLTDPANAARRYSDRTFRVHGGVDRFDRALVAREFAVMLVSPDRATTVKFKFNYVGQYHSVFTVKDGRELVARSAPGSDGTLLKVTDSVVLSGRCHGLKNGTITFTRSEIVH